MWGRGALSSLESNHHIDWVNIAKPTEERESKGDDHGGGICAQLSQGGD